MIRHAALAAVVFLAAAASATTFPQTPQSTFSAAELDRAEGGAIYRNNCMRCHGPDGDEGSADVAARSTAGPDDALLRTVIGGVPGTPMGPSGLTAFEATTVIRYLGAVADDRVTADNGDPARGRDLVAGTGGCLECHTIGSEGGITAPDLSAIGATRRSGELRASLVTPNAEVRTENRYVALTMIDNSVRQGRLLNQDSFSIQILGMNGRLEAVSRDDVAQIEFLESPMPSFADRWTAQQIHDVVRYLVSLK